MSNLPYFPLWVSDYEAKTAHLSFEEDGAYGRLLRLAWTCPGGTLPHDDAWLMRRLRATEEMFDRVVRPVLKEFFKVRRGRYVNDRLKEEFDKASEKTARRKSAGKMGGEAKARKEKELVASNAKRLSQQTHSKLEPKPESKPVDDLTPAPAFDFSDVDGNDLDQLEAACRKWANGALAPTAGPMVLAPIVRLLKPHSGPGVTMDDVRTGIMRAAESLHRRGEKVGIAYFEKPILQARDQRLRPNPEPEVPNGRHERPSTDGGRPAYRGRGPSQDLIGEALAHLVGGSPDPDIIEHTGPVHARVAARGV